MISSFPKFKRLHLDDQKELEHLIRQHPPHSDYNLASLWSYDTDSSIQVSRHHNNLVVQFRDYLTGDPVWSFLGTDTVEKTIEAIFAYQKKHAMPQKIALLDQKTIHSIANPALYHVSEDRDNYDYIVKTADIIDMKGTAYLKKRNKINSYNRTFGPDTQIIHLDLSSHETQKNILSLFDHWEKQKKDTSHDAQTERIAIEKFIRHASRFTTYGLGMVYKQKLIAFALYEVVHENHGVIHFEKADRNIRGVYEFLKQATAKHLQTLGCHSINLEQDLGLVGLRAAKMGFRPSGFVKKYTLTPISAHQGSVL